MPRPGQPLSGAGLHLRVHAPEGTRKSGSGKSAFQPSLGLKLLVAHKPWPAGPPRTVLATVPRPVSGCSAALSAATHCRRPQLLSVGSARRSAGFKPLCHLLPAAPWGQVGALARHWLPSGAAQTLTLLLAWVPAALRRRRPPSPGCSACPAQQQQSWFPGLQPEAKDRLLQPLEVTPGHRPHLFPHLFQDEKGAAREMV